MDSGILADQGYCSQNPLPVSPKLDVFLKET
jgi:hypothetical protein